MLKERTHLIFHEMNVLLVGIVLGIIQKTQRIGVHGALNEYHWIDIILKRKVDNSMGFFDFEISEVAKITIEQCKLFNCSIDICWEKYIHPIITEQFTLNEVKQYIESTNN